jgi:hypothetical protein
MSCRSSCPPARTNGRHPGAGAPFSQGGSGRGAAASPAYRRCGRAARASGLARKRSRTQEISSIAWRFWRARTSSTRGAVADARAGAHGARRPGGGGL